MIPYDHEHPCQQCGVMTTCSGDYEENHDGWPEVICVPFDTEGHSDFICEECWYENALVSALDDETADTWPPSWVHAGLSQWDAPTSSGSEGSN